MTQVSHLLMGIDIEVENVLGIETIGMETKKIIALLSYYGTSNRSQPEAHPFAYRDVLSGTVARTKLGCNFDRLSENLE